MNHRAEGGRQGEGGTGPAGSRVAAVLPLLDDTLAQPAGVRTPEHPSPRGAAVSIQLRAAAAAAM